MVRIGTHVGKEDYKNITLAIEDAAGGSGPYLPMSCCQIFVAGPRGSRPVSGLDPARIQRAGIPVWVHASYVSAPFAQVNPASPKAAEQRHKHEFAVSHIRSQSATAARFGSPGLVVHLSRELPPRVAEVVPKLVGAGTDIILEMPAAPAEVAYYHTPEGINTLCESLRGVEGWGLCLDTSHLWSAGIDCRGYDGFSRWLGAIAEPQRIRIFHANGSSLECGSGRDHHQAPFVPDDKIWGDADPETSGFRAIVEFSARHGCDIVLEINRGEVADIAAGEKIVKGLVAKYGGKKETEKNPPHKPRTVRKKATAE